MFLSHSTRLCTSYIFIILNSFTIGTYNASESFIVFWNIYKTSTPPTIITNMSGTLISSLSLAKYSFDSNIFYNSLSSLCNLLTITSTFFTFLARTFSNLLTLIVVSSYIRPITSFSDNPTSLSPLVLISLLVSLSTLSLTIFILSTSPHSCCSFSSLFSSNGFSFLFYSTYYSLLVNFAFSSLKYILQLLYTTLILLFSNL